MKDSRAKGAAGEREAAKEWAKAMGLPPETCRRGQQFHGGKDSPDVVHALGDTIHLEVKRVERGNPYDWMTQAEMDCGGKVPVVLHRRNNKPWLVVLRLDHVHRFVQAATGQTPEAVGGTQVSADVSGEGVPPAGGEAARAAWLFRHG